MFSPSCFLQVGKCPIHMKQALCACSSKRKISCVHKRSWRS